MMIVVIVLILILMIAFVTSVCAEKSVDKKKDDYNAECRRQELINRQDADNNLDDGTED